MDYTFKEDHLEKAKQVVDELDRQRKEGVCDEYRVIAQAICDAEMHASKPKN